jgi:hypothetical protein
VCRIVHFSCVPVPKGTRSHGLAGGRKLAGHASVAITSVYLQVGVDDDDNVGNLFRYE